MPKVIEERRQSVLKQNMDDHDLLIELRTEMRGVREDIQELNSGTAAKLTDLETRMRFVEKYVWGAIGIIGLINLIGFAYIVSLLN